MKSRSVITANHKNEEAENGVLTGDRLLTYKDTKKRTVKRSALRKNSFPEQISPFSGRRYVLRPLLCLSGNTVYRQRKRVKEIALHSNLLIQLRHFIILYKKNMESWL